MNASPGNSTVVMVHGAWADGSCWSNVILPLRRQGLTGHRRRPFLSHLSPRMQPRLDA